VRHCKGLNELGRNLFNRASDHWAKGPRIRAQRSSPNQEHQIVPFALPCYSAAHGAAFRITAARGSTELSLVNYENRWCARQAFNGELIIACGR
jgi:hypothetical protein